MKFARRGPRGHEIPVVLGESQCWDLRSITDDINPGFFASDGPHRAAAALAADALPPIDVADQRWGSPIATPGAIVCIGLNYAAHAAESGAPLPQHPVIFLKLPNTLTGPYDPVAIPRGSQKTDWEVELGVVIGTRASYLDGPDEAMATIAGFVTANDLSEREFQLDRSGGQWSKGKCCAGFTPLGPWLSTPQEFDPSDARLRSWVNGQPRQDSTTADMIFDVAAIIADLSQYLVLDPGDLILTGTPQGVGLSGRFDYLRAGDLCEVEVAGLGRQRTEFLPAP